MEHEALLESRKSRGRASNPAHCPQKSAVLCTEVVHVWSGNELFGVQLHASSCFIGQQKY